MLIDLKPLFAGSREFLPIDFSMDLSEVDFYGIKPLETPVKISGKIISRGFTPNVMMELGYLLHKLKNACKVRRILINTNPKDLPSDLQGMWSTPINYLDDESSSESADPEEKLNDAAEKIVTDFFDYIKKNSCGSAGRITDTS